MRIFSMPDKWEFSWFADWDLTFQCFTLALVDPEFAKENLWVLLFENCQHPNGQVPAYEWEFLDLNPPFSPGPAGASTGWKSSAPAEMWTAASRSRRRRLR